MLLLVLNLACAPSTGTLEVGEGNGGLDDTGPTGGDDTGDTNEPDPEPDTSLWQGWREISYDGCTERIEEEGYELDDSWEYWDYVRDECPKCDHFYVAEVWPDEACGLDVSTTIYRGLVLDAEGGEAEVWAFSQSGTSELDDGAAFDGMNIDYGYELYDGYVEIEGRVEFPEL